MRVRLEIRGSRVWSLTVRQLFSWRLIMKYFLWSFSLFRWFKKGSCQFLSKECAQVLVKDWEKSVVTGKLTALNMTPMGWLGCKTSTQNKQNLYVETWEKIDVKSPKYWYFSYFSVKKSTSNEYPQHMFSWRSMELWKEIVQFNDSLL